MTENQPMRTMQAKKRPITALPIIPDLVAIAEHAGQAILNIYRQDKGIKTKTDGSPVTLADHAAHDIICTKLKRLTPQIPILSEESPSQMQKTRQQWRKFWLVDPLDGTKEFIQQKDEFTVNIALIQDQKAVLGVVHAPALSTSYWGCLEQGTAFKKCPNTTKRITVKQNHGEPIIAVTSKSHPSPEAQQYLKQLEQSRPEHTHRTIHLGSSLKLCMIAEGKADVYPRMGPTSEWDIAAAQAIVEAAGGFVVDCAGNPLRYNKSDILNPWFIASGQKEWLLPCPRDYKA